MIPELSPTYGDQDRMARQKKGFRYLSHRPGDKGMDPAREIGHSNWVFSYADMMNSMVVFLVLLLSFSTLDFAQIKKASKAAKEVSGDAAAQEELKTPLEKVEESLNAAHIEGVTFEQDEQSATMTIKDSVLFESGHAGITQGARKTLRPIFDELKTLPKSYHFVVEGHTDDNPISTFEYASNWELSAARALSVMMWMQEIGIESERTSFHAFGEFHPLYPNRDNEGNAISDNQAKNRRAVIKILQMASQ